jgi:HD-GYP domain-containing protein (c-di-GMP phosphodiesterase class II)
MRQHPEIGYAMIAEKFDRRVSEAILYHHERYDGGGYPFGLSGTKIPVLSRIVLVADAFDAITSHRAYQPALSADFAISEIINNSGTQFDPAVVEAFLAVIERDGLPASRPGDRSKDRARILKRLRGQPRMAGREKATTPTA